MSLNDYKRITPGGHAVMGWRVVDADTGEPIGSQWKRRPDTALKQLYHAIWSYDGDYKLQNQEGEFVPASKLRKLIEKAGFAA